MKHIMKVGLILIVLATLTIVGVGATAALAAPKDTQEVQGILTIITTSSPPTVTIAPNDSGTPVVLQVKESTLITKAGIGKASLSDLVVNDRVVATYTVDGANKVAVKLTVSEPLSKNYAFVGNMTVKSSSMFKITTKKQVDVPVTVNDETKYKVPGVKEASLANFNVGDRVAVLAAEITPGTYTALHVNLIPGKPVSVQRVGTVSVYVAGASITITGKKVDASTFVVNSNTKIVGKKGAPDTVAVGDRVTVTASRDPATDTYTAKTIMVFGVKGKP
jgi:hypothetical protein